MSKKVILVTISLVVVGALAIGWSVIQPNPNPPATSDNCTKINEKAVTITFTAANEFAPSCLIVPVGTEITWNNQNSAELQVGVDPHPIHSGNKALTGNEFVLTVPAGTQKTQGVSEAGTYSYHNHLSSSARGTVKVE